MPISTTTALLGGEQRFGNAQLVVLVAGRRHRGQRACQHVAHKVLRGGLAGGTRQRDHATVQVRAPFARDVRHGVGRVGHLDNACAQLGGQHAHGLVQRLHHKRAHGAAREGRTDEVVAVHALARQRDVHVARLRVARVPGEPRGQRARIERLHHERASRACGDLLVVQTHAIDPRLRVRRRTHARAPRRPRCDRRTRALGRPRADSPRGPCPR